MPKIDPAYLIEARKDLGQRETLGPNDSPFIRSMLKRLGLSWLLGQPWCGNIMALWMIRAGYPVPAKAYRALSWATWGITCHVPAHGAVAVLTRKGGGHVGIVTAVTADGSHVRLHGGNQNDSVSEQWFPSGRITHYRLPAGAPRVPAAIAKLGSLSTREA